MIREIKIEVSEFLMLLKGHDPHLTFKEPDSFGVGNVINVLETSDGKDTGRILSAKVVSVTEPGSNALLPPEVGIVSLTYYAHKDVGSRLFKTLNGHKKELEAAFIRSGAHKLPGSKGRLRERAVSRFLEAWMPNRYRSLNNVFFSHNECGIHNNEVDLVLYDSHEGAHWALDGDHENWMLSWNHVKVTFEIKSTLNKEMWDSSVKGADSLKEYGKKSTNSPLHILFAYKIEDDFKIEFSELMLKNQPFDLIVLLEGEAYLAERMSAWANSFIHRLMPDDARDDIRVVNADIMRDINFGRDDYYQIADNPQDALISMLYMCIEKCAGSSMTLSLLSALGVAGKKDPLFSDDFEYSLGVDENIPDNYFESNDEFDALKIINDCIPGFFDVDENKK